MRRHPQRLRPGPWPSRCQTDLDCVVPVQSGNANFVGWLSSADTIEQALASGLAMTEVGEPVFYESLGVAFDNTVADNDSLVAAVDAIIGEMHAGRHAPDPVPEVVRRQGPGDRPVGTFAHQTGSGVAERRPALVILEEGADGRDR